jgi:predicted permease
MSALLLLIVCLTLGMAVKRFAAPPPGMAQSINWWVINIALPALVLTMIPHMHLDPHLWFLVVAMWVVFAGSWLLFGALGRRLNWSRGHTGAMVLACGLGNTSFIGFPMLEALRGSQGLQYAIIADQVGGFTTLAAGGLAVTAVYAGHVMLPGHILRRMLMFPPTWALAAGAIIGMVGALPPTPLYVLDRLGQTMSPLALFSVGLQFRLRIEPGQFRSIVIGLGWKMLLAPVLCWLLGRATGISGTLLAAGVLQAASAPMVSAAILAEQYNLEPHLATTLLGVGILISLVSLPLINLAL